MTLDRRFLSFLFFLSLSGWGVFGEEVIAVLYTSPVRTAGIEVLEANAIPNYSALYRVGEEKFKVIYTEDEILVLNSWKKRACGRYKLFEIPCEEGFSFFYKSRTGYALFFVFKKKYPFVCSFVKGFIQNFTFFMNFRKDKYDIPFPAIVSIE